MSEIVVSQRRYEFFTVTYEGGAVSGLTNVYRVSDGDDAFLGVIRWYSKWKQYVFSPEIGCTFSETFLRDIAREIETLNAEHLGGKCG